MKINESKYNRIEFANVSRTNNEGSSILLVIVAIAFVGILGTAVLMLAMTNLQMKYTDLKAKSTFYSAEKAIEQIKTGLETEVSEAFLQTYEETLQNYANESAETRLINFRANYINNIKLELQFETNKYSGEFLKDYIDTATLEHITLGDNFVMLFDNKGIRLQNIKLTYQDENDIVSIIETDILLKVPPFEIFSGTIKEAVPLSDLVVYENWIKQ